MGRPEHDILNSTNPAKCAQEILPLLRAQSISENAETLRDLVSLKPEQEKIIETKLGPAMAQRTRTERQQILAELENLLAETGRKTTCRNSIVKP
jgi:hypothetical protein